MKWTRMRLLALLIVTVSGLAPPAWAVEESKTQLLQDAAVATGNGTPIAVHPYTSIALQVTIADTATVTFEVTADGSTWTSHLCTLPSDGSTTTEATASGAYQCNVSGMALFRARISSWTSGAVTVFSRATTAVFSRGGTGSAQGLGPNFALTSGNVISGATEAKMLEILGSGGQATSGIGVFQHSNGTGHVDCIVSGVLNACDYYRQLAAGKKSGVKDSSGNILMEVDEATGAFTAQVVWDLDLVAVVSGTASHIWNDDPLSTACTPLAVAGTNRTTGYCTFTDADGDQGRQISRALPARMLGILDADVWWKTTGTGNARFQFQTKCYADDEADDAAFNTASVVTAAAGTSARPNKQTISAITLTGCAAGELLRIRFYRNRTEGSDTLNAALDVEKVVFRLR